MSTDPDDILALPKQRRLIFTPCPGTKGVAIHCRGGSGRTGFMAAVIMRELGIGEAQATDLMKGLRPNSLKLPAHT